jgi:hypothetical protein
VLAARLAASGDADAAGVRLKSAGGRKGGSFESSAARAILSGKLDFLDEAAKQGGRANDVAWLRALAARLAGDEDAAAGHERRAAELSRPPGEFPGMLVPPAAPRGE